MYIWNAEWAAWCGLDLALAVAIMLAASLKKAF